ncbi:MAG: hypothetical protein IPL06_21150 [Betaproteobacteria bacterium]|nr:hypothetical protein [Betaproteobacteria bacterium]
MPSGLDGRAVLAPVGLEDTGGGILASDGEALVQPELAHDRPGLAGFGLGDRVAKRARALDARVRDWRQYAEVHRPAAGGAGRAALLVGREARRGLRVGYREPVVVGGRGQVRRHLERLLAGAFRALVLVGLAAAEEAAPGKERERQHGEDERADAGHGNSFRI